MKKTNSDAVLNQIEPVSSEQSKLDSEVTTHKIVRHLKLIAYSINSGSKKFNTQHLIMAYPASVRRFSRLIRETHKSVVAIG